MTQRNLDEIIYIGRIYKLTNDIDDKYYIGSTELELSDRLNWHRLRSIHQSSPCHRHFNEIDWDNVVIEELEQREDIRLEDLLLLENSYLKDIVAIDPNCLNRNIAYVPEDQRIEWEKEINRRWYVNNREYALNRNSEWNKANYKANPEKYQKKNKERYQENREDILKEKKEARQGEGGDAIREKDRKRDKARGARTHVDCECGGSYNAKTKASHLESQIHMRFITGEEKVTQTDEEKKLKVKAYGVIRRANMEDVTCTICFGTYPTAKKNRHEKSKQHTDAVRWKKDNIQKEDDYTICQICFAGYKKLDNACTTRHTQSARHQRALPKN